MRATSILVMTVSVLLIIPAALAAMVAPFGLGSGVELPRQLFSFILLLSPLMLLIAGLGALFALQDGRRVGLIQLSAFVSATMANGLFWIGV